MTSSSWTSTWVRERSRQLSLSARTKFVERSTAVTPPVGPTISARSTGGVAWPGPEIDDAFANRDAGALPAIEDGRSPNPMLKTEPGQFLFVSAKEIIAFHGREIGVLERQKIDFLLTADCTDNHGFLFRCASLPGRDELVLVPLISRARLAPDANSRSVVTHHPDARNRPYLGRDELLSH